MSLVREDLHDYCPVSNHAVNDKIVQLTKAGKNVYHFAFGQSPFPVIEEAVEALKDNAEQNDYLPVSGISKLRNAICDFHCHFDDLHFLPEQVIVAPGSKELIFLLISVFGGDILIPSPSWTTYKPQSVLAGHKPIIVENAMEEGWKLVPEKLTKAVKHLEKKKVKLLIFCNPDNPSGIDYTNDQLKSLSLVCQENNIIVLSDEIYARLHFKGEHNSIAKFYPEGTILSSGLSKWASAGGWRIGYHIYPPELMELLSAVSSAASNTYSCAPAPMQYAVSEMMSNIPACDEYIQHSTRILKAVSEFCVGELQSAGVKVIASAAAYCIFPNFEILREPLKKRHITTCEDMCTALFEEANVAVIAGGPAFLRPLDELTTRLCYVNFNGKLALNESRRIGLSFPLPDKFVENFCCQTFEGIKVIVKWVKAQLEETRFCNVSI